MRSQLHPARLVAICLFGCVLLSYPMLSLFDRPVLFSGWPLLFVYMFGVWLLLIVLLAVAMASSSR